MRATCGSRVCRATAGRARRLAHRADSVRARPCSPSAARGAGARHARLRDRAARGALVASDSARQLERGWPRERRLPRARLGARRRRPDRRERELELYGRVDLVLTASDREAALATDLRRGSVRAVCGARLRDPAAFRPGGAEAERRLLSRQLPAPAQPRRGRVPVRGDRAARRPRELLIREPIEVVGNEIDDATVAAVLGARRESKRRTACRRSAALPSARKGLARATSLRRRTKTQGDPVAAVRNSGRRHLDRGRGDRASSSRRRLGRR